MSTAYLLTDDGIATPLVAPTSATLTEKLEASRRLLAAKQAQERDMTDALGKLVIEAEEPAVQAARSARSQVRQDIGDLGAAIRQLEQDVATQYDSEQRTNADAALTAAAQFDAVLVMLLNAIRDVDAAGKQLYGAANRARDPRANALLGLTWDTGALTEGFMLETLRRVTDQVGPWNVTQPSLLDAARSRAQLVDWE